MRSDITAIIPVYNGRRYLREAVESVLKQTLRPDRLIIVDDGSSDDSLAVLEGMELAIPLTVITQENRGQAASRNRGIALVTTTYIALLDQDDAWYLSTAKRWLPPCLRLRPWGGHIAIVTLLTSMETSSRGGCLIRIQRRTRSGISGPACLRICSFCLPLP
jgi:GT2 family glycosyltransferase